MKFFQRFSSHGLSNTLLFTCATAVAGLCSGIVLARSLSPISRGEFAAILLWPGALSMFGDLGLGFAFSYFVGRQKEKLDGLWTLALVVSLIWGGLLSVTGLLIFPLFVHVSETANYCLKLNLITVPMSLFMGFSSYFLLGSNWILEFNVIRFCSTVVYTLGIIAIALMARATVFHYTLVFILAQLLACVLGAYLVTCRLTPKFRWDPSLTKPVFTYGGKTYLSSLAAQMNLRLDQLLMSSLVPMAQLGFYVIAVSFSSLLMPLFSALAIVTIPRVTQAPNLKAGGLQIVHSLQLGFGVGLPVMVLGIFTASWLIPLIFGGQYISSVLLGQVLLIAVISQGSNIVLGNGLRGLGHPGKTAISEGVGLVVTIVLLACMLPRLGALGAALASLIAYSFVMCIQIFFVCRAAALTWRHLFILKDDDLAYISNFIKQMHLKLCSAVKRND